MLEATVRVSRQARIEASRPNTLLPFLYATPTILNHAKTFTRGYTANTTNLDEKTVHYQPRHVVHRRLDDERGPSDPLEPSKPFRPHYIPFDRSNQKTKDTRLGDSVFENTTVTASERRAFERLLKLSKPKRSGDSEQHVQESDLFQQAKGGNVHMRSGLGTHGLDSLQPDSTTRKLSVEKADIDTSGPKSYTALQTRIKDDLSEVQNHLMAATTDYELWQALLRQVLSRLSVLKLDRVVDPRQAEALKQCTAARVRRRTKADKAIDDLDVLMVSLPRHLHQFVRILREKFPSSPLGLTLIPFLKKLGPSAYALAASTPLYNAHMTTLYELYHDLAGVAATLEDMDRHVYAFDENTQILLDRIIDEGHAAQEFDVDSGLNVLARMDRTSVWLQQLSLWRNKIEARRQQDALRKAQEKEAILLTSTAEP